MDIFHSLVRELICLVTFNNSPLDQSISSHTTTNPRAQKYELVPCPGCESAKDGEDVFINPQLAVNWKTLTEVSDLLESCCCSCLTSAAVCCCC